MIDQSEEQHAAVMAIAHALTPAEKAQFLARTSRWPGMNGAEVADILDMIISHDEFLGQTEPFFEAYGDLLPECSNFAVLAALHALIILERPLSPAVVTVLLQQAGVTAAPQYIGVKAGIRNEDGSLSNSLLIMARAEQALRAEGVNEVQITAFRTLVGYTRVPGLSRNIGDIAGWVTLVDGYIPLPRKLYDPVHDLAVLLMHADLEGGPDGGEVALSLDSLRSHIGLSSLEEAEEHLRALLERKGPGR